MTANFKENISSLTPTNAQGQEMIFSLKINLFLGMIQYAKQQGKARSTIIELPILEMQLIVVSDL